MAPSAANKDTAMLTPPLTNKSFDLLLALFTIGALLAVLQTFIVGQHYIIPTSILAVAMVSGNLAWWGLQRQRWAKWVLFWGGCLLTAHSFMALFWSHAYRVWLGAAFEPVCAVITLLLGWLCWRYARDNRLFTKNTPERRP